MYGIIVQNGKKRNWNVARAALIHNKALCMLATLALALTRAMENPPPAEVWTIWITAGLTWPLAEVFCMLRYFSWKKKRFPR